MKRMKEVGYNVNPPENGKALIDEIMNKKAISEFRWTTIALNRYYCGQMVRE